jgi:hypothetical protein
MNAGERPNGNCIMTHDSLGIVAGAHRERGEWNFNRSSEEGE